MVEYEDISLKDFQVLVERSGMRLTTSELEVLKPMYDHYARQLPRLHNKNFDRQDLAVAFSPDFRTT